MSEYLAGGCNGGLDHEWWLWTEARDFPSGERQVWGIERRCFHCGAYEQLQPPLRLQ